jgi:hypothetical protein
MKKVSIVNKSSLVKDSLSFEGERAKHKTAARVKFDEIDRTVPFPHLSEVNINSGGGSTPITIPDLQ